MWRLLRDSRRKAPSSKIQDPRSKKLQIKAQDLELGAWSLELGPWSLFTFSLFLLAAHDRIEFTESAIIAAEAWRRAGQSLALDPAAAVASARRGRRVDALQRVPVFRVERLGVSKRRCLRQVVGPRHEVGFRVLTREVMRHDARVLEPRNLVRRVADGPAALVAARAEPPHAADAA